MLGKKLGTLPESTIATIKSLDSSQLDRLTEEQLDFERVSELEQWLERLDAN
ncbi:MAG: DUF4351 domain-containing protein [Cyanobacteria bacterium J06623_7]